MKFRRFLTVLGILTGLCAGLTETGAQTALDTAGTRYRIAFYNVENLFYPTRDTNILDEDYTPGGSRHWGWAKFETKCHRIFKVIAALDAENPLLCIGLAEVENERALQQLCYGTPLRYGQYRFVHFDSPDRRGIDVALLYRADRLEILRARPLPVGQDSGQTRFLTRDILSVQARVRATGDTLYLFVVHFPSKFGGALATDARRRQAGGTLRRAMDSIRALCPQAKLLAMGDFNATAGEAALRESIGYVGARAAEADSLAPYVNLMADFPPGVGSHKYRETWSLIDHIVVGRAVLPGCRWRADIFKRDFLLTEDKTYFGQKPFRTFVGPAYQGGYSDHLPVYIDLNLDAANPRPTR
ncbi:MAG: endonuclease [Bacteroidales bacterium]|nr:endonuclease [Bacteroidales bacterium]